MADTPWNSFADGVVADDDIFLVQTSAGGGKNPRGNRFIRTDASGNAGVGTSAPAYRLDVLASGAAGSIVDAARIFGSAAGAATVRLLFGTAANAKTVGVGALTSSATDGALIFYVASSAAGLAERARFDSSGNFLVGTVVSSSRHAIEKSVTLNAGASIMRVGASGVGASIAEFFGVSGSAPSAANAAAKFLTDNTTGRSINAGGTVNTSGADYAEYMTKADGCGVIATGQVAGVTADGQLTLSWSDALSFVVKSTNPSYVGGDTWAQAAGEQPVAPAPEPAAPAEPGDQPTPPAPIGAEPSADNADAHAAWVAAKANYDTLDAQYQAALAAWQAATDAYPAAMAQYQADHDAWAAEKAQYDTDFAAWQAALEAERQKVDRVAFAGQVPVNISGAVAAGDYVIAAQDGAGIKAIAVAASDITFDQYRLRLGKVWAVREGQAWIDVQHG